MPRGTLGSRSLSLDSGALGRRSAAESRGRGTRIEYFLRLCSDTVREPFQNVPFYFERAAFGLERLALRRVRATKTIDRRALGEQTVTFCRQNVPFCEHFRRKCSNNVAVCEHFRRLCSDKCPLHMHFAPICSNKGSLHEHSREFCSYEGTRRTFSRRLSFLFVSLPNFTAPESDHSASRRHPKDRLSPQKAALPSRGSHDCTPNVFPSRRIAQASTLGTRASDRRTRHRPRHERKPMVSGAGSDA